MLLGPTWERAAEGELLLNLGGLWFLWCFLGWFMVFKVVFKVFFVFLRCFLWFFLCFFVFFYAFLWFCGVFCVVSFQIILIFLKPTPFWERRQTQLTKIFPNLRLQNQHKGVLFLSC